MLIAQRISVGRDEETMKVSPTGKTRGKNKTVYTTCICNCGNTSQCVFKAHVRDGVVVAVEPDDRYNTGVGREDEVLSEADLIKARLQRRPCTKGLAFHRYIYHPERILYPLKRAPGSQRGDGKYVRISWDEALSTIAEKMEEARENYGPYSTIIPYMPNETMDRLFSFWGAGTDSWGWCSFSAGRMMAHITAGVTGWDYAGYAAGSAPDMLANAKSIVLWGFDPTIGMCGPGFQFAWFVKLARERGRPVIIIDPKYSVASEVIADQWIPIRPGTDSAMILAMAYIIFEEDLWDKKFVARFVEPEGFARWREYVLGAADGIPKTPKWAEEKCAVPAETIRALTRLVTTEKPSWLWCHWSASRKSRGEQTVRAFVALQAMLGYWGTPGAGPLFSIGPTRPIPRNVSWGPPGEYQVPKVFRSHYWAQAVLMRDRVDTGELSGEDYMRMIGWKADPSLLEDFHPRVLLWGGGSKPHASDHVVTACDSTTDQVKAMLKMDFVVNMHSIMTSSVRYSDIILPAQDWMWEEKNITVSAYGGFECINYCPGVVKPPGEVKPWVWVYTKLAEKLGIDPQKFFRYYTSDENWDKDWERYLEDSYQGIVDFFRKKKITVPTWQEFTRGKFINCEELEDRPFTGWDDQIRGGKPFKTASGKIELYSKYIADEANSRRVHYDPYGRTYDNLEGDLKNVTPSFEFQGIVRGIDDPMAKEYPLVLMAPHARYRVHYLFWEHPWLKDHIYRHRVWLHPGDAKARGIKDDDLIEVFNDRGKVVMPAYVTSRIMPGLVVIHHGGKYVPDESGVDFGGSPSTLLGGDFESCITPAKASSLVQVKKYKGAPA
ncbi:MAG: molybdopterin-dependent oxidoreductase [Chloroflexota bacterium]